MIREIFEGAFEAMGMTEVALIGSLLAFFMLALVIGLIVYIYTAFAIMFLAKRTKTKDAWLAWIPFVNIYLLTRIAKKEWWWTLIILFAGIMPFIGWIITLAATAYIYYFIAKRRKYPEWTCILSIIPLVNLVYIGFLAWGK